MTPQASANARLIAAYTQRYDEANRLRTTMWLADAVLFLVALALVATDASGDLLGLLAAAYLLVSRAVLRPEMGRAHREAVGIQEQFDVGMFGLPEGQGPVISKVPAFDIADLDQRFDGDRAALADWYIPQGSASDEEFVLLRQLENVAWGRRDHGRFRIAVATTVIVSAGLTVCLGVIQDVTLSTYLTTLLVPALPWLLDLIELAALHHRACTDRGNLEERITTMWRNEPTITTEQLRGFQDEIYAIRRDTGRVPSWFYRLYRDRNEQAFSQAADDLLQQRAQGASAP